MSSRSSPLLGAFAGAALLLLSGCGGGKETGTTCPPGGTTLTYQNFGQSFMGTYCLRCHNSALTGSARKDAPSDLNFNTVEEIRAEADEIDEQAGASADVTNEEMPPDGEKPTVEDRRKLAEWLACGAP
jgi:mono/diheme cytochrome c family protein